MPNTAVPFSKSKWVLASSLGWLLSIAAILLLSGLFDAIGVEGLQFYLGLGIGAGLGFTQWRRLRRSIPITSAWVWVSVTGMGFPFLLFDLLKLYGGLDLGSNYIIYSACLAGLNVGLLQAILLKKYSAGPWIWIPGSFTALAAATALVLCIDLTKDHITNNMVAFFLNLFFILAGGPLYGLISAGFMASILKKQ